jgi:uncharacterized protein
MYGELNTEQIDGLLARNRYGRIGFQLEGQLYITPINYAYEAGMVYGHAPEGTKVRAMRENPTVAFEVDEIETAAHWRSVLLHGRFSEIRGLDERREAFQRILQQAGGGERSEVSWALGLDELVLFKIVVGGRSGRFEERQAYALRPARTGPLPPTSPTAASAITRERK